MASYVKRGKTWTYIVSFKNENGEFDKVRKGGFRTKTEATAAAREVESAIAQGHNPNSKKKLFSDYFKNWMEMYKKPAISEITYRKYEVALNTIEQLFPVESLEDLTRERYQRALNQYAERVAETTVKRLNSYIKACLSYAIEDRTIFRDPTFKAVISGNNARVKKDEAKFLEKAEYDLIMANLDKRDLTLSKTIVMLAAHTGARYAEILAFNWSDFSYLDKTLTIDKSWQYKLETPQYGDTKNKKSRIIPVSDSLLDFIKCVEEHQVKNNTKSERIIYDTCSNSAVNTYLRKIQTQTGLHANQITLHGLRHTHASLLIYADVNIMIIAERLGHKDVTVTQTVYAHVLDETRKRKEEHLRSSLEIF